MKRSLAQPKISTKTIPIIYMYIKFVIDAYNRCIWLVYLLAWIRPRSSSFPQLFERPENLRLIFTTTICAFQAFFVFHFCGLNSCFVVGEHPVTSRGWGADSAVIPTVRVLLRSGGRVLYSVVARVQERGHHTVHTDRGDQDYLFIIFIFSCTHQSKNTQD